MKNKTSSTERTSKNIQAYTQDRQGCYWICRSVDFFQEPPEFMFSLHLADLFSWKVRVEYRNIATTPLFPPWQHTVHCSRVHTSLWKANKMLKIQVLLSHSCFPLHEWVAVKPSVSCETFGSLWSSHRSRARQMVCLCPRCASLPGYMGITVHWGTHCGPYSRSSAPPHR